MKLIADSGSTKTEWLLIGSDEEKTIFTEGYNPNIIPESQIISSLQHQLFPEIGSPEAIEAIYFYGAGCEAVHSKKIMQNCFKQLFNNAKTKIESDLMAACIATCGTQPGTCVILGTGSNSCSFDGATINEQIPALGYILGDEGSGNHIGRQLIKDYFYREMPIETAKKLEQFTNMDRGHIIKEVFQGRTPNRYLASFAKFCSEHPNDKYVKEMLINIFSTFFEKILLKYRYICTQPCNFVGGIANTYRETIEALLTKYKIPKGRFLQSPFPELGHFFKAKTL